MSNNLAQKIIRQVEYYFGDVNMSKDKFMQEEIQKDSGWIPLDTLIKFNRLKALSTDIDEIINALKISTSGLLEIEENDKKVRRAKPLPDAEFETTIKQNTVYVKGFPQTLTLDELYAFFESYGKVIQIFMRRLPTTRQFKGSVFVTFDKNEDMKSFLELKDVKYKETDLLIESQEDYRKRKGDKLCEINKKKEEKTNKKLEKENKIMESVKKGALIHIKGCNEECTRECLKELFDDHAKIEWVYYSKGEPEATLRFSETDIAKPTLEKVLEANKGQLEVKGAKLECRVLEGEEENEFIKTIVIPQIDKRGKSGHSYNNNNNNKRKRKQGGRNKSKGKKNKDDDDDDDDDEDEKNGDGSDNEKSPNKKVKN